MKPPFPRGLLLFLSVRCVSPSRFVEQANRETGRCVSGGRFA